MVICGRVWVVADMIVCVRRCYIGAFADCGLYVWLGYVVGYCAFVCFVSWLWFAVCGFELRGWLYDY